ncbi:MAG: 3-hydroxyacyl-CoA dehydrogenase [Burkholderiaceae bacterium]
METIAVIGAGLIGCAWATVFARAGHPVVLYDADPAALASALDTVEESLTNLHRNGLISELPAVVRQRISVAPSLAEALRPADYVQENVRESVQAKQEIFAAMDQLADSHTILASSTSGIPASSFTADLTGRGRCLVAHPVNPPSLIPLVELVPAPWTEPSVMARARVLHESVGQVPIVVQREIQGFIVNRLQGALLNEAFRLVEDGYVSGDDVDKAVKDGLGLRWSFMGPFETIDLNAPGGVRDYCGRYGPLFYDIAKQAEARPWSEALIEKVAEERLQVVSAGQRPARQALRDQRLTALVAHKRSAAKQGK